MLGVEYIVLVLERLPNMHKAPGSSSALQSFIYPDLVHILKSRPICPTALTSLWREGAVVWKFVLKAVKHPVMKEKLR